MTIVTSHNHHFLSSFHTKITLDFLTESYIFGCSYLVVPWCLFSVLCWNKSHALISILKRTFQMLLLCAGGELGQMVKRPLRMRDAPGSTPGFSKSLCHFVYCCLSLFAYFLSFFFNFGVRNNGIVNLLVYCPIRKKCVYKLPVSYDAILPR